MEEQKRLEYEQWLKQQQKEQQMFECSVKYEEKADESSSSVTQGMQLSMLINDTRQKTNHPKFAWTHYKVQKLVNPHIIIHIVKMSSNDMPLLV